MSATKIINVKIFDGIQLSDRDSVTFENGMIVDDAKNAAVIDGTGATLLPALIDAHVHLYDANNLKEAAKYGIGTMFDMGVRSAKTIQELRALDDVPQVLSGILPAFAPGSKMPATLKYPESAQVKDVPDAARFVREQIENGADYIKVLLEEPRVPGQVAFDEYVLSAIVENAHDSGKKVIAHSVSPAHFTLCAKLGIDVVTHIPFFRALPSETVALLAEKQTALIPTMGVMKGIAAKIKRRNWFLPIRYKHVKTSVRLLREAGLLLMAGTDSNMGDKTTPCEMPYGKSLHDEFALMADAGLTPQEVLASATSVTADYWGLNDRGIIEAGRRADLLLVKGDPLTDIKSIRNVQKVWLGGREVV